MSSPSPKSAARQISGLSRLKPALAVILGSGFGHTLSRSKLDASISYSRIPGFPPMGVRGHAGTLHLGMLAGTPVIVMSGRVHYYEGHSVDRVTFAVRALAEVGVQDLLLTNAAGGINRNFRPGEFMVVTDHINLMGMNPLCGAAQDGLSRFVDLTHAYNARLNNMLFEAGRLNHVKLRRGVYLAVSGPSYETPAEIRAFAKLGADAVGMSTVPEAIVARQCGLNVAALSCITNLAAGVSKRPMSHEEVLETGERVKDTAGQLLESFAKLYGKDR
jgi:purine-nucleoside phosphorylase